MLLGHLALALPALGLPVHAAVTSLFIPAADQLALAAKNVGTDASGHTTWVLAAGSTASGTLSTPPFAFPHATMVAGSSDLHFLQAVPGVSGVFAIEDCAIADTVAACTMQYSVAGAVTTVGTTTVPVTAFPVQLVTGGKVLPTDSALAAFTLSTVASSSDSGSSAGTGEVAATATTTTASATGTGAGTNGAGNGGAGVARASLVAVGAVVFVAGILGNVVRL
ncbi:uncharacterized protein BXZ73DRAFT_105924 [Epithele typhae]|uniref:uncharacterized protein n=1 Tax=Epithele typhae TaxID=378194 RepID=UPI002007B2C0|nr:uncharacterized protein BXZ73DRAFT_105924 [Epithele typhae]KAH9916297.1 hypothetical protein BXZ73DRAFT_105924 [Epithele typhae]